MIDITNKNKAEVLAKLYNASKPQGLGFLQSERKDMTIEEAKELLKITVRFDYVKGRVIKVNLSGDEFNPALYDRDNGQGAALKAINGS